MIYRRALLLLALAIVPLTHLWSQGALVNINPFASGTQPAKIFTYSGTDLVYICQTTPNGPWNNNSVPSSFSWTRAATTLTDIVDSANTATATTSTAHGLRIGNPAVVAGVTTDTDLNGTYVILTVPSSTTFTFTTANVTDNTYTDATMTLTSTAPRSNTAIWQIQKLTYASNLVVASAWANGSPSFTNACDSASTYSYR